jgi:hypothetical protein
MVLRGQLESYNEKVAKATYLSSTQEIIFQEKVTDALRGFQELTEDRRKLKAGIDPIYKVFEMGIHDINDQPSLIVVQPKTRYLIGARDEDGARRLQSMELEIIAPTKDFNIDTYSNPLFYRIIGNVGIKYLDLYQDLSRSHTHEMFKNATDFNTLLDEVRQVI